MTDTGTSIADGTDDLVGSLNASPPFNALAPDRIQEVARDQEAAAAAAREIPDLACVLLDDGADAVKIGHVISSSIDALTGRLLAFAIDDLGEPPVPWAWMALGSEARLEHQARQIRAVIEPDDFVDPAELGPIERLGLKEAFRIIGNQQRGLATQIGARY